MAINVMMSNSGPSTAALVTGVAAAAGLLLIGFGLYHHRRRPRNYKPVRDGATVSNLILYPIKALPGIEMDEMEVTGSGARSGLFADRSFILLDQDRRMITQRADPSLALLRPRITGTTELSVERKDGRAEPLKITLKQSVDKSDCVIAFKIWGTATKGIDCGQEASNWFSDFLGKPDVRLVQHVDSLRAMRPTSFEKGDKIVKDTKNKIRYQDGCPFMLINQASIRSFNENIPNDKHQKTDHRNWRPNILIESKVSYVEDDWAYVKINGLEFFNAKPCIRCSFPSVNPDTGIKDLGLFEIIKKYRAPTDERQIKLYEKDPLFGINLNLLSSSGKLSIGDSLEFVEKQ